MRKDLRNNIETLTELLLEDDSFYENQATDLKTGAMIKEKHEEEIKEFLEHCQLPMQIQRALELIKEISEENLSENESQLLNEDLDKINEVMWINASKKIDVNSDVIIPYQKLLDISDSSLLSIYSIVYDYVEKEKFVEAIDILTLLTLLNPTIADFTYSLGLCYQQQEKWEDAVVYFTLSIQAQPHHVPARVSLGECFQHMGNYQGMREQVDVLEEISSKDPQQVEGWQEMISSLKK